MKINYQFSWLNRKITIESPIDEIVHLASRYLALPLHRTSSFAQPDIIIKESGSKRFLIYQGNVHHCYNDDMLLLYLASFVAICFFHTRTDLSILHAGAFMQGKGAVLFSGSGYVGKSTLAFHAWKNGHKVLGDDWLVYDHNTTVLPLPKPVKPRMNVVDQLKATKGLKPSLWTYGKILNEQRLMISREEGFYNGYEEPVDIKSLYFIDRNNQKDSRVLELSKEEGLQLMFPQTLVNRDRLSLGGVKLFEKLWQKCCVYKLSIGDNDFENAINIMLDNND